MKPRLELSRNNAGRPFIGVTEFDGEGRDVRAYVLSHADEYTADDVMKRRFEDMCRLMGDNVESKITLEFMKNYTPGVKH